MDKKKLEAALLDRRQGYDAPVPGLAEARGRIATLEAALRRIAEQKLGEETWDDLLAVAEGCVAEADAALAAQPAQEGR